MEASEEVAMINKSDDGKSGIRYYTTLEELSKAINAGLSLQDRRMSEEEAMEAAEHIINFFGYNDRVIDNMLEPEDRDSFYTMEDIGILQTEREETTLFDGREWRIHYWILNINKIIELANMKVDFRKKKTDEEYRIYDEIPDDYWKVVQ
ncbi:MULTISPECIES: DUF6015 family protein [unclassified Thermoplasma]|uniref:DUF6015 family protein n=1 Tax=unclassified Thermoplasma TaxID=2684908 RepID=UPI00191C6FC4|nr:MULTISPECIES: DUF6015 family protein [unclassified Thermoplasma]